MHKSLSTSSCQIKTFNQSQKILEQSTNFQRKRNTVSPIKTLGFQDRLSGIAPSFDFVNFVKKTKKQKKNLFEIFPRIHVSFPVTSEKFCYFICHSLRHHFFRHPILAIMIDLSVSGIGFHKNVPVKMEKKIAVPGKPLKRKLPGTDEEEKGEKNKKKSIERKGN